MNFSISLILSTPQHLSGPQNYCHCRQRLWRAAHKGRPAAVVMAPSRPAGRRSNRWLCHRGFSSQAAHSHPRILSRRIPLRRNPRKVHLRPGAVRGHVNSCSGSDIRQSRRLWRCPSRGGSRYHSYSHLTEDNSADTRDVPPCLSPPGMAGSL